MPGTDFSIHRRESGQLSSLTFTAVTRLTIGLLIAALIVIALTNPSGAQMNKGVSTGYTPFSSGGQDNSTALFVRCLQDWDSQIHMTKKEWSGACRRLLIERAESQTIAIKPVDK